MTPDEFRRIALALPEVVEGGHMGHPDFRVRGKIFATLGYPRDGYAVVMLSPHEQDLVVRAYPKIFAPVAGKWGAAGSTSVALRNAGKRAVTLAVESAWLRKAPRKLAATRAAR